MYNITQATKAARGNELGIFEEGDFYAAEDLILFFATFAQSVYPFVKVRADTNHSTGTFQF
jgi:hypothetical protein